MPEIPVYGTLHKPSHSEQLRNMIIAAAIVGFIVIMHYRKQSMMNRAVQNAGTQTTQTYDGTPINQSQTGNGVTINTPHGINVPNAEINNAFQWLSRLGAN